MRNFSSINTTRILPRCLSCSSKRKSVFNLIISTLVIGCVTLTKESNAQDPANSSVTILGKKAEVTKKIDRTVYDVSNLPRAAIGTAQDVLQSTPQISVAPDGKISVNGNSNVTVLIDGKPSAVMSGEEQAIALQTMSGADIANIEVMTNPSAAYNANGGSIINIVLKRNRKLGAHSKIQASFSDDRMRNVAVSGDVTEGNLSLNGSLADRRDGNLKIRQSIVDWQNPSSRESMQSVQKSEVFVRRHVESAALGIDYSLSKLDSLSFSGRYNSRRSKPLFDVLNERLDHTGESKFHRISYGPNEQSDDVVNLSYNHQSNDYVLKATIQHSNTVGLIDKSYRDIYLFPIRDQNNTRSATKSARHLSQAKVDWSHATDHGQWGIGLDIQSKFDDISNYQASLDILNNIEVPDLSTTNSYAVKTVLSAAYLTDRIKYEDLELLIGVRAEDMELSVEPNQLEVRRTSHWQALNPSLNLMYSLNDTDSLSFSFRRSLQMPDSRDLNPFTTYLDAQNLNRGNPSLKPQILNSLEMGVDVENGDFRSNLSAIYRTSRDTVTDVRNFANHILITSKQNGGRASSNGVVGTIEWKPNSPLQLGVDIGIFKVMLVTPDLSASVRQHATTGYANIRATYGFKNSKLSLDAHAQSAGITPLGSFGKTSSVNLSWNHQLSTSLNFIVNANDIFDGSKRSYKTYTSTFRQSGFDHVIARRIYLGLVKKFE